MIAKVQLDSNSIRYSYQFTNSLGITYNACRTFKLFFFV